MRDGQYISKQFHENRPEAIVCCTIMTEKIGLIVVATNKSSLAALADYTVRHLESSGKVKHQGLILDKKFNWSDHVSMQENTTLQC